MPDGTSAKPKWLLPAVVAGGALLGLLFAVLMPASWLFVDQAEIDGHEDHAAVSGGEFYACPMFCTRAEQAGVCPVCGMTMEKFIDTGALIPLDAKKRDAVGLRTEPIQRRLLAREIRTLGAFEPDETRVKVVAAWVEGRIERLYADFTGVPVAKGWHLFDLYSPQLYSAQNELIVALRATRREGISDSARRDAERLLEIAREKLRLLGLLPGQIAHIEAQGEPKLTLTIPSPDQGVVVEKMAHVGMYVMQGEPVFKIADLSRLWLIAEIHERDLGFVALGQHVEIGVSAFPGRSFSGRVGFIDPMLDPMTRTVRVRVEVPNPNGDLRPGMFGSAAIFAELAADGELATPRLPGEHACPMHPLQRGEQGAECPICGMDLVASPQAGAREAGSVWAIPREAVLSTGKRNLVYVEWWVRVPEHEVHGAHEDPPVEVLEQPMYQGFEVKLGPLAAEYHIMPDGTRHKLGEYYPLISGVPTGIPAPGIRIVTKGQFLIDSQMELTGKPSLMRPEGGKSADPHAGHGG